MIPILRRLGARSHSTAHKLVAFAPRIPNASITLPNRLPLSEPAPITPRLVAVGIDHGTAHQVTAAWSRFVERLKTRCEADFAECRQIIASRASYYTDSHATAVLPLAYAAIYEKTLQHWATYIIDNFAPRLLRAQALYRERHELLQHPSGGSLQRRRPFNQSAVPLLEAFFDENAFPSRLDKHELASKCDMDYRQIHVWFQNRRSRSRKEGKGLKKCHPDDALLDELENHIVESIMPMESEVGRCMSVAEDQTIADRVLIPGFSHDSPAHAFPAPYPPLCNYDPFPTAQDKRCFVTPWLRLPQPQTTQLPSVGLPDLVDSFTRLSIAEDQSLSVRKHPPAKERPSPRPEHVTRCLRAPHPASIRITRPDTNLFIAASSDSTYHATRRPDPQPCKSHGRSTGQRPKRSLPRRSPRYPPAFQTESRGGSQTPISNAAVTRSPSVSSQTSVSSGLESDVETPLATPPPRSTSLLPVIFTSPDPSPSECEAMFPSESSKPLSLPSMSWDVVFSLLKDSAATLSQPYVSS